MATDFRGRDSAEWGMKIDLWPGRLHDLELSMGSVGMKVSEVFCSDSGIFRAPRADPGALEQKIETLNPKPRPTCNKKSP